jgi:hypothetical protein
MKKIYLAGIFLITSILVKAQDADTLSLEERIQKLEASTSEHKSLLDQLWKLKITGYVQAQYQVAQSDNITSYEGGNFGTNIDKRFQVRRGRIKFTYDGNLTKYVLQFEATEGGVSIKEAYAKVTEPWSQWVSLQAGVQTRPFGNEVLYSSSSLESPERGRMSQILFNSEEDLGAQIIINPPKTSPYNFLTLQGGFFSAVGPKAVDFDKFKDFIGRLSFAKSNKTESVKYSGGISYYNGGFRPATNKLYEITGSDTFAITNTNLQATKAKREHYGVDAQLSFLNPLGLTTIRAEYITGKLAGTTSYGYNMTAAPSGDTYLRKFDGAYLYFIHAIANSKISVLAKYDWYNPNKDIDQSKIGTKGNTAATKTTAADVKYGTLGLGLLYRWDANVKFSAYYAIVNNSTNSVTKGDIKDNVFTLRVQYKF